MADPLILELEIRLGNAEKQIKDISKKAADDIEKTTKATEGLGSRGVRNVRALKDWFEKARIAALAASAAIAGTLIAIKSIGDQVNVMQAQSPLNLRAIEAANKALGGTVDKLTLARTLQQTSLSTDMFGEAAKAAAFMAKQFGFTKQNMLETITNGSVMETQLLALGTSQQRIANLIAAEELRRRGALNDVEKSQIRIKEIIKATRRASNGWTASTKQAGDAAGKALADMKNIAAVLGAKILPFLTTALQTLNKIGKSSKNWLKDYKAATKAALDQAGVDTTSGPFAALDRAIAKQQKKTAERTKKLAPLISMQTRPTQAGVKAMFNFFGGLGGTYTTSQPAIHTDQRNITIQGSAIPPDVTIPEVCNRNPGVRSVVGGRADKFG